MLIQPFLGRLIVVRRYRQATHYAGIGKAAGERNGFSGGVGAGTGDHRNAAVGQLQRLQYHVDVLVMGKRCGLAGSPYGNDSRGSTGYMIINQFF